jgi:hypothetical protein
MERKKEGKGGGKERRLIILPTPTPTWRRSAGGEPSSHRFTIAEGQTYTSAPLSAIDFTTSGGLRSSSVVDLDTQSEINAFSLKTFSKEAQ